MQFWTVALLWNGDEKLTANCSNEELTLFQVRYGGELTLIMINFTLIDSNELSVSHAHVYLLAGAA